MSNLAKPLGRRWSKEHQNALPRDAQTLAAESKPGLFAWLAYFFLISGVCFTIAGVKMGVGGIPYRALCFFASAGLLILSDPNGIYRDVVRASKVLTFIGAFALLGSFVSVLAGTGLGRVIREVIEIHVQAVIIVTLSFAMVRVLGLGTALTTLFIPVLITGSIAIAQALGIGAAWELRAGIGSIMNDPSLVAQFYVERSRALGVSYSPVHVGTQTCAAFAGYFCWRMYRNPNLMRRLDIPLIVAWMLCVIICIASGNRSPILGFAVFLLAYGLKAEPRRVVMALPILMFAGLIGFELMQLLGQEGARFAQTDDSSAAGRSTLAKFGMWLVLDRPQGWGFAFNSVDHWPAFAHDVIYDDNPMSIRKWPPHNFYILLLAKYGVLAIPLVMSILPRTRLGWGVWFAFLPYGIHIYFHNDGPLSSDNLVWIVISAAVIIVSTLATGQPPPLETRRWTRAYRAQKAIGLGRV